MKNFFRILFVFFAASCFAQKSRPKIALVLSGGGAKGIAEIPLIEALESEGIRPDMVLGTSMGSLIGSLYAAGYSPKQIRETLLNLDFAQILSETPDSLRSNPPEAFSRKNDSSSYLGFSLARGKFGSAPGIIGDHKILGELNDHLSKVLCIDDFDELPVPFRAIATNVSTGEQIVLKNGSIVSAVRASISIPAVFTPANLDGETYAMDGGLRNNLPLKLAREMGADIVISMDVASVVDTDPRTLSDFYSVAVQIFNLIISSNAVEQYDFADMVLRPDLTGFSTLDFLHVDGIIKAGEICVEQNRDKIKEIALRIKNSGGELHNFDYDRISDYDNLDDPFIDRVEVKSISFLEKKVVPKEKEFASFTNRKFDDAEKNRLEKKFSRVKEKLHLSSLSYNIKKNDGGNCTLEILANNYEQDMNRIFLIGEPSVSITNDKVQKYLCVNPQVVVGGYIFNPIEALVRFSYGTTLGLDASIFPFIAEFKNFKLNFDLGDTLEFGGLEPKTDYIKANDRGVNFHGGLRLRHTDYFSLRSGVSYSAEKIMSQEKWFNSAFVYNEFIFTTLHGNFLALHGETFQAAFDLGRRVKNARFDGGTIYSVKANGEARFEILDGWNSIGASASFFANRFPYETNSGYSDFGGVDGMCGIPLNTMKRDFALAEISFRQKLGAISGMPVFAVAEAKASVSDSFNPVLDGSPSDDFFADRQFRVGGGLYLALHSFAGNFVVGGSLNSKNEWCVFVGFK